MSDIILILISVYSGIAFLAYNHKEWYKPVWDVLFFILGFILVLIIGADAAFTILIDKVKLAKSLDDIKVSDLEYYKIAIAWIKGFLFFSIIYFFILKILPNKSKNNSQN